MVRRRQKFPEIPEPGSAGVPPDDSSPDQPRFRPFRSIPFKQGTTRRVRPFIAENPPREIIKKKDRNCPNLQQGSPNISTF